MTSFAWLAVPAVVLGGVAIATQAPINARLARGLGDPVAAAAISFLGGFLVLGVVTLVRDGIPEDFSFANTPWWAWTGGAFGAFYVWSAVWSVGALGVVTMIAALIFGQLIAALALDALGAFGLEQRAISPTRLAAVAFVAVGLVLSRI